MQELFSIKYEFWKIGGNISMIAIIVVVVCMTVVGIIMCCAKIGADGNWYAEHMAENAPDNDPER